MPTATPSATQPGATERADAVAASLRLAGRRFGTPCFVTDLEDLAAAAASLEAAFPDPWIRQYSVKANDVAGIVGELGRLGLGANVVSRGEWSIARRAGLPNTRISLEGVGKTDADLGAAVRAAASGDPLRWVALESPDEAAALARLAERAGLGSADRPPLDVLLRLNPDVVAETAPGLAVGAGVSKFGMDETELSALAERLPRSLRARGIHLHVGSQLAAVDAWRDAARRGLALLALVRGGMDAFDTLDLGGGFPVVPAGAVAPTPARFARELPPLIDGIPPDRRPRRLAIEPGRFLVARAGWLVARVLHTRRRGDGLLVVLDAGMTELIRPALYGARHEIVALTSLGRPAGRDPSEDRDLAGRDPAEDRDGAIGRNRAVSRNRALSRDRAIRAATTVATDVHGPVCESTDALGTHHLPPLRRGDLVAIADAGAYAASLGTSYNGRPRPPQLLLDPAGGLRVARRRGSVHSLG